MAWPNTPLTTYLAGGLPYWKAADANALQTGINGIINATYSLAAVVVDGTGGSVVVPVAGTMKVSGTASGVALATTTVPWGVFYKESALFGYAAIDAVGGFIAGYNVLSCSRVADPGQYRVTFNGIPTNVTRATGQMTGRFNAAARICELNSLTNVAGNLQADIFLYDQAGALANGQFDLHVWGG